MLNSCFISVFYFYRWLSGGNLYLLPLSTTASTTDANAFFRTQRQPNAMQCSPAHVPIYKYFSAFPPITAATSSSRNTLGTNS